MFVEKVETLRLHELVLLLDIVEADDAAHHGDIPGSQELPPHLDELEHDGAAAVLLALGGHLVQQRGHGALLQTSGISDPKSRR